MRTGDRALLPSLRNVRRRPGGLIRHGGCGVLRVFSISSTPQIAGKVRFPRILPPWWQESLGSEIARDFSHILRFRPRGPHLVVDYPQGAPCAGFPNGRFLTVEVRTSRPESGSAFARTSRLRVDLPSGAARSGSLKAKPPLGWNQTGVLFFQSGLTPYLGGARRFARVFEHVCPTQVKVAGLRIYNCDSRRAPPADGLRS
jgi:hypothetical protein